MDSAAYGSRDRAGEDEPMLGVGPSSPGADADRFNLDKAQGRKTRRTATFWIVLALCALTVLALPVFFLAETSGRPAHQQADDAAQKQHGHGGQDLSAQTPTQASHVAILTSSLAPPSLSTPAASEETQATNVSVSPVDELDLKTGFVVAGTPQTREYVFNITRATGAPDGVPKQMILVNGQSPGPLIEANTGDRVRVTVHNQMAGDSTSIHWHGIDQRESVWMDGVHGVTQCAIPPGESFTYEFELADQRGTFWYHAHVTVQYTDGLYGPLIIHDKHEMVPVVDDDKILMIGDVFHGDGGKILTEFLGTKPSWSPKMPGMDPPPDNLILNGQSEFDCSVLRRADHMMEHGDPSTSRPSTSPLQCTGGSRYKTRVKSGQNLRLRLISHSTATPYWFNLDNHTLSIVEVDGVEIEPVTTTRVFMYPGQRYSVLVAANQTAGNYVMRASAATKCFHMPMHGHSSGKKDAFATVNYEATGILSYDETDFDAAPLGDRWDLESKMIPGVGNEPWKASCKDLPFNKVKPIRVMAAYDVSEKNSHYFTYTKYRGHTFMNGTEYEPPIAQAMLWDALDDARADGNDTLGAAALRKQAPQHIFVSEDVEKGARIVINSDNMMAHPWHLHGQNFQIVGWGRGLYGSGKTHWNLVNPMRRDTVTVPGNSHMVLHIRGDNPGLWIFHCHILWHAEGGMMVTLASQLNKLWDMLGSLDTNGEDDMRQRFCAARPTPEAVKGDVMSIS